MDHTINAIFSDLIDALQHEYASQFYLDTFSLFL